MQGVGTRGLAEPRLSFHAVFEAQQFGAIVWHRPPDRSARANPLRCIPLDHHSRLGPAPSLPRAAGHFGPRPPRLSLGGLLAAPSHRYDFSAVGGGSTGATEGTRGKLPLIDVDDLTGEWIEVIESPDVSEPAEWVRWIPSRTHSGAAVPQQSHQVSSRTAGSHLRSGLQIGGDLEFPETAVTRNGHRSSLWRNVCVEAVGLRSHPNKRAAVPLVGMAAIS